MNNLFHNIANEAVGTTFTPFMKLINEIQVDQTLTIKAGGVTGSTTTLNVTPQFSYDKIEVLNQPPSTSFAEVDTSTPLPYSQTLSLDTNGLFVRFKIVVAGDGNVTAKIAAAAKGNRN